MACQSGGSANDEKESIIALALNIVKGGDLNTLTIRKVKELLKEQIDVEDSYDEQLTELVKVAIDRHVTSLQESGLSNQKKRGKPRTKNEEFSGPAVENIYHRLTKVCRQLGIGLPINKLKGIEEESEKIEIVKEYLKKKGVKRDPLLLTEKQLKSLRAKLEREKELESLDTSNILKDSSKRKRTGVSLGSTVIQKDTSSHSIDDEEVEEDEDINSSSQEEHREDSLDSKPYSSKRKRHKTVQVSDEESV
ncbi:uncharacterized protein Gasu_11720 [Galdieria sulphuraria]|uniref:DEK C-terminal domain-containing protein n=1 Tax=Galdieria sulphuraria TaxID=130081 RepID=M2Y6L3_GALSU|nr:uncharacterized protein Gasu_11720 [Galdieria sulphuraria]EME31494.1 hypothetical protein Gasu_11720 [Galdieria sulphuraria]|eukprot:XP_005708014.1 hypothetical protein Gasu_11720 [Galdieria sulphuraria]